MFDAEEFIAHHGVKGMHWGVRRARGAAGLVGKAATTHTSMAQIHAARTAKAKKAVPRKHAPSEDAAQYKALVKKAKKGSHTLSNEELKQLTSRHDLEQKFSKIHETPQKKQGENYVKKKLKKAGDKNVDTLITAAGAVILARTISKAASKPGSSEFLKSLAGKVT